MKQLLPVLILCFSIFSSCKKTDSLPTDTTTDTASEISNRINQSITDDGPHSYQAGDDVDIDGNNAIIGDPAYDDLLVARRGAAYIYNHSANGTEWTKTATLKHPNGKFNDNFGFQVAIDGNIAVSCTNDSLYYFKKVLGNFWVLQQAFVPNNLPAKGISVSGISIDGDYMIVGNASQKLNSLWAVGAVYFFKLVNNRWVQKASFNSPNASDHDWFGTDVAMHGNYALVSARGGRVFYSGTNGIGSHGGKLYGYIRLGETWIQQANLSQPEVVRGDEFGTDIDFNGEYAAIGASEDGRGLDHDKKGRVYIFQKNGASWVKQVMLQSPDNMINGTFGKSVSINDNYLVVGGGGRDGAIYVYHRIGKIWVYQRKETSPLPNRIYFGSELAMDSTQHYVVGGTSQGTFSFGTIN